MTVLTDRLEIRSPKETDRDRMVELWRSAAFTVFSNGTHTEAGAHARFDRMVAMADRFSFAKQPVIERASGIIVGYVGVDVFDLGGTESLEFGWRLDPAARGLGYATEAATEVLKLVHRDADAAWVYAIIDPANTPSLRVAEKLGFTHWRWDDFGGRVTLQRMAVRAPA